MHVYGNISMHPEGVTSSVYEYMSAVLAKGLVSLYVLDGVIYFESVVDISERTLKGLAVMSTLQQVAPFSKIVRPKGLQGKVDQQVLDNILGIVVTSPETQIKS